MKKQLWFKAKNYGWGWYPSSWQGWLILLIYTLALMWNVSQPEKYLYFVRILVATLVLIFICYKTGERPEWRWGKKKTT